jgi:hypothetical protein
MISRAPGRIPFIFSNRFLGILTRLSNEPNTLHTHFTFNLHPMAQQSSSLPVRHLSGTSAEAQLSRTNDTLIRGRLTENKAP